MNPKESVMGMGLIKEIALIDISGAQHVGSIVRLNEDDHARIRTFILECYHEMSHKEFFIVDDIDYAFPALLRDDNGIFLGVSVDEMLIAVQGIDFGNLQDTHFEKAIPNYHRSDKIAELGWAMVSPQFAGNGISNILTVELEHYFLKLGNGKTIGLTVHPQNTQALYQFFKAGFHAYCLSQRYGIDRLFMLKDFENKVDINDSLPLEVDYCDYNRQTRLFSLNNFCVGMKNKGANWVLLFCPIGCKSALS